ncbi:DNRLRE domain-containing protein [Streptomyces sp. PSRA5]|uniref:DNRLRE domain-containing protein n=1 Tax=Streptomyces panacea TaxID=3035064 RepID=UPI00339C7D3A
MRIEGEGGESVTLGLLPATPLGGKALKPTKRGAKVTYLDAVEGADLEYVVEPGQVKKNIVLVERPDGPVNRQYPVVIDPTITVTPDAAGSKDTMVLSDQPTTNFNTTWKLSAGKTDLGLARSLVQFPLTEIPAGVKVDSARLGMYFDQSHTTNAADVTIGAYRATGTLDRGRCQLVQHQCSGR